MDNIVNNAEKVVKDNGKKVYLIFQIIMCLVWLLMLYGTEWLYSIYVLTAVFGIISAIFNFSVNDMTNTSEEIPERVMAGFLAACVVAANYECIIFENIAIGLKSIMWMVVLWVSGYCLFYNMIRCVQSLGNFSWQNKREEGNSYKAAVIAFLVVLVVDVLFLFGHVYPGTITADSIWQLEQAKNHSYFNHHPFWHTFIIRICLKVGARLFGDMNGGVAVYSLVQIVLMAFAFAYAYFTMHQMKVKKWIRRLLLMWYVCMPFHIAYSATMWKDVFFAGFVLIYVVALIRIVFCPGNNKWNYLFFVIGTIGFVLFRNNGWIALAISIILYLIFFFKESKKLAFIMLAVLLLIKAINVPVFKHFNVTETSLTESLSIPLQQIARVVVDGGDIESEERELLEKIIDVDEIPSLYTPNVSDPIKIAVREMGNEQYIIDNKWSFLVMWAKIGLKNPCSYITAWIDQTKGYWNGGYEIYTWSTNLMENDMGIYREKFIESVSSLWSKYSNAFRECSFLQPFINVGLHVWILLILGIVAWRIEKLKLLPIIPIVALWLTLLIATPVCGEFRYIYSMFTCLPIILVTVFYKREELENVTY